MVGSLIKSVIFGNCVKYDIKKFAIFGEIVKKSFIVNDEKILSTCIYGIYIVSKDRYSF